jgi:hypothetical protein
MKATIKFISGSIGALVLLWLAATTYGLVVAYLPIPQSWREAYPAAITYGTELTSFLPFVFVGACASRRLFKSKGVLWAFVCILVAFGASFGAVALESRELLEAVLRMTFEFVLIFAVGVPSLVFLMERRHANKRNMDSGTDGPPYRSLGAGLDDA